MRKYPRLALDEIPNAGCCHLAHHPVEVRWHTRPPFLTPFGKERATGLEKVSGVQGTTQAAEADVSDGMICDSGQ